MSREHSQALSSITFVITTIYTVTFANAIYLMSVADRSEDFSLRNLEFDPSRIACGTVALVMTARFFFGNNQYVADVMVDSTRSPWVKFYQFFFVALQSIVLLVCSYSVPDPPYFVLGIAGLFALEVFWYFLTMVVDRKGVLPDDGLQRRALVRAEMTNLGFVIGVGLVSIWLEVGGAPWLGCVVALFAVNSAYDFHKNMATYMGNE